MKASESEGPMAENPYEPGDAELPPAKLTRPTRWLIWSGVVWLLAAVGCFGYVIFHVVSAFNAVASSTATPRPSELARGISEALVPSGAAVVFLVIGVVLMVAGVVIRRPVQ